MVASLMTPPHPSQTDLWRGPTRANNAKEPPDFNAATAQAADDWRAQAASAVLALCGVGLSTAFGPDQPDDLWRLLVKLRLQVE